MLARGFTSADVVPLEYPSRTDDLERIVATLNTLAERLSSGFPEPATSIGELHATITTLRRELDTLKTGRRLTPQQSAAISDTAQELLKRFWEAFPPEEVSSERFVVWLISIGSERETLNYRDDMATALELGGFHTEVFTWPAGKQQYEPFTDAVTVLTGNPKNLVRPIVVDALRAGRVEPLREANEPFHNLHERPAVALTFSPAVATVAVGQRR